VWGGWLSALSKPAGGARKCIADKVLEGLECDHSVTNGVLRVLWPSP
jgi:hypothetical protein